MITALFTPACRDEIYTLCLPPNSQPRNVWCSTSTTPPTLPGIFGAQTSQRAGSVYTEMQLRRLEKTTQEAVAQNDFFTFFQYAGKRVGGAAGAAGLAEAERALMRSELKFRRSTKTVFGIWRYPENGGFLDRGALFLRHGKLPNLVARFGSDGGAVLLYIASSELAGGLTDAAIIQDFPVLASKDSFGCLLLRTLVGNCGGGWWDPLPFLATPSHTLLLSRLLLFMFVPIIDLITHPISCAFCVGRDGADGCLRGLLDRGPGGFGHLHQPTRPLGRAD